jgi:VanZ family protein
VTPERGVAAGGDRRATLAFIAVVLLSLVVLFTPQAPGDQGIPDLDKAVHAGLFALLAATTWWRFGGHRLGFAAVIAYAALSEVAQSLLLTSRHGDVRDVCADAAGAILGWLLARRLRERRGRPAR